MQRTCNNAFENPYFSRVSTIKALISITKEIIIYLFTFRKSKHCENCPTATATEALKKQIEMRPDYEGDGYDNNGQLVYDTWVCPRCGVCYEIDYDEYKYCPNCGQRIKDVYEMMAEDGGIEQ